MTRVPSSSSSWIASRYSSRGGWNPSDMPRDYLRPAASPLATGARPGTVAAGPSIGLVAKILLLDGNSLAYRAFFALPTDMATASGQVTNAVFGFTSMLINLLKDHQPDGIGVALDRPEPTFRHALVS